MLFLLKKAIWFALMPVSLAMGLMAAGLWMLWRNGAAEGPVPGTRWPHAGIARGGKRRKLALWLVASGLGILFLGCNATFSNLLMRPLETRYPSIKEMAPGLPPPPELLRAKYIVVLGAGNADAPALPAMHRLSSSALARVSEAVRLIRVLPDARLIVSGPGRDGRPTHAAVLEEAAVSLGVDRSRIIRIEQVRDTEDEARTVKSLVGDAPVVVVTSAWHMPRAAMLFHHFQIDAIHAPTDYLSGPWESWDPGDLLWSTEHLNRSNHAIHEWLGQLWNLLRGRR